MTASSALARALVGPGTEVAQLAHTPRWRAAIPLSGAAQCGHSAPEPLTARRAAGLLPAFWPRLAPARLGPSFGQGMATAERATLWHWPQPSSDGPGDACRSRGGRARLGDAGYPVGIQKSYVLTAQNASTNNSVIVVLEALGLIVVGIALIGLVSTLTLAIIERTREVGILRCLGAGARQIPPSLYRRGARHGARRLGPRIGP